MSQIGCFGKRSPVSGSREPSPVALEKRTGTKIKLPEWMSRFFISIGLIDRKVAPPKHSLCAALLRKTVDPRAVMSELVKLSNDLDDEILQNLSRSELKKIHRSIGNNMETILAAIMELHEALGQDRSENDGEFLKHISSIHVNLVTLLFVVENKSTKQRVKIKKIDPKIDASQRKLIVDSLKSAWRDCRDYQKLLPSAAIQARLTSTRNNDLPPARPMASAPLTRPRLSGRAEPAVTSASVWSEFSRAGTIHPGFKNMVEPALAAAGIEEPARVAEDVIEDLNNVRADVRRELLGDLLQAIDGRGARQDETTLLEIIGQIGARAREAEARTPALGLEGAFTVEAARDRIHDLALTVLRDFDDKLLAWATIQEISSRSTPGRASTFLQDSGPCRPGGTEQRRPGRHTQLRHGRAGKGGSRRS